MNNSKNDFDMLQEEIDNAIIENKPIDDYVKQQIEILKKSHDEFIHIAEQQGYDINSLNVAEIEIEQYSVMKLLAQKINLPVEEYDKLIKNVQIRILGEKNYKNFIQ